MYRANTLRKSAIAALFAISFGISVSAVEPQEFPCSKFFDLTESANGGDSEAEFTMFRLNTNGHCTLKNPDAAARWLARSALHEYAPAQVVMASMLHEQGENGAAMRLARMAAVQGNPHGEGLYGFLYLRTRNHQDAGEDIQTRIWAVDSAERGNQLGRLDLAEMYSKGIGVHQDAIEADKWYILAEKAGVPERQHREVGPDPFSKLRVIVESRMTDKDIDDARKRADSWLARHNH